MDKSMWLSFFWPTLFIICLSCVALGGHLLLGLLNILSNGAVRSSIWTWPIRYQVQNLLFTMP